jgi:adenosylcobinamide-phosphate synthase
MIFGSVSEGLWVLALAWWIDRIFGYPDWIFKRIGHPVTWIGKLIAACDDRLNVDSDRFSVRRRKGVVAILLVLTIAALPALILHMMLSAVLPAWLRIAIEAVIVSTCLAQKSLHDHVKAVADGLEQSLDKGRKTVSMIVGRDTTKLDEAGVSRAAIESLAENTSDGIVAPAGWALMLGLPGVVLYKALNTADSMIGHKSDRHLAFGWASARLDDLANWPWSRLNAILFAAGAALTSKASPRQALGSAWRDAQKHQSPNAGWPEAAMAGALGFALGGPRSYDNDVITLPVMGSGRMALTREDIRKALSLQQRGMMIAGGMILIAAFLSSH